MIKQYDQQYELPVIQLVSSQKSELLWHHYGRVYSTWVDFMKLNELPKYLYCYPVDDMYKRSCGDDNGHNTNSIDVLVDFSTCPDPEIVEWMKNARRNQQEDCGRLADKDYDSFSSEDHDYLKAKIAFLCLVVQATSMGMIMEVKILSNNEDQRKCKALVFDQLSANLSSEINVAFIFLMIKQFEQQYKLPVISSVSFEKSEIFLDLYRRVYNTWVHFMKLNELPKCLYNYPVDERYKRSCGDDNDDNTHSIDVLVDFSTSSHPEIVEWMKNARSSQQDHCDRLADKDYDSLSSEDYDYLKVKIAFPCLLL